MKRVCGRLAVVLSLCLLAVALLAAGAQAQSTGTVTVDPGPAPIVLPIVFPGGGFPITLPTGFPIGLPGGFGGLPGGCFPLEHQFGIC
jgi:hypothetical protein